MNQARNKLTHMTDQEVLDGIRQGEIHPNSRTVAQHNISPQEIFCHLPKSRFAIGVLYTISDEEQSDIDRRAAEV